VKVQRYKNAKIEKGTAFEELSRLFSENKYR
jgi:hypothetical protein